MAKVFISHSTVDKPFVRRLQRDLQSMGMQTWLDEEKAFAGYALGESLEKGIKDCTHFLIIISPDSVKSDWVRKEIDEAIALFGKRNIIPVVYRKAKIPENLDDLIYVDFSDITFALSNDMTTLNYYGSEYPENLRKIKVAIQNTQPNFEEKYEKNFITKPSQINDNKSSISKKSEASDGSIRFRCKVSSFSKKSEQQQLIYFIRDKYPYVGKDENLRPIVLPSKIRSNFQDLEIGQTITLKSEINISFIAHFCGFVSNRDTILLSKNDFNLLGIHGSSEISLNLKESNNKVEITFYKK